MRGDIPPFPHIHFVILSQAQDNCRFNFYRKLKEGESYRSNYLTDTVTTHKDTPFWMVLVKGQIPSPTKRTPVMSAAASRLTKLSRLMYHSNDCTK
jgi:hypothetical protein